MVIYNQCFWRVIFLAIQNITFLRCPYFVVDMMTSYRCIKFNLVDEFVWNSARVVSSHCVRHSFWPALFIWNFWNSKFELYCIITVFKIAWAGKKCQGISMFFIICLSQKMPRQLDDDFSDKFQAWFLDADHLLYYPHISVFCFHIFVVLLYQFLRNGT